MFPARGEDSWCSWSLTWVYSNVSLYAKFVISSIQDHIREIDVLAVIVPRVSDLNLAVLTSGNLPELTFSWECDVFTTVIHQGRQTGVAEFPSAFETDFGWVLAGSTEVSTSYLTIVSNHTLIVMEDELLRKFWEIEEQANKEQGLSPGGAALQ